MTGTLKGTDCRADGGIGVSARGGEYAAGKRGVVTAAVLCVHDKAKVKEFSLLIGIGLV